MITLYGVWDRRFDEWAIEPKDYSKECACEQQDALTGDLSDNEGRYEVREFGQFIQAPPQEVVEAVKAIGGGPVVVMQPHQESVHRILNWAAQAVATQEQMK